MEGESPDVGRAAKLLAEELDACHAAVKWLFGYSMDAQYVESRVEAMTKAARMMQTVANAAVTLQRLSQAKNAKTNVPAVAAGA